MAKEKNEINLFEATNTPKSISIIIGLFTVIGTMWGIIIFLKHDIKLLIIVLLALGIIIVLIFYINSLIGFKTKLKEYKEMEKNRDSLIKLIEEKNKQLDECLHENMGFEEDVIKWIESWQLKAHYMDFKETSKKEIDKELSGKDERIKRF